MSGDCLTKIPEVASRRGAEPEHVAPQQHVPAVDADDDDARSVMSSSSIGSEIIGTPMHYGRQGGRHNNVPNVPVRRRRKAAEQLGPVQNLPRLRSGRR